MVFVGGAGESNVEDFALSKRLTRLFAGTVLADVMSQNEAYWVTDAEWQEQGVRALDKLAPRTA